MRSSIPGSPLVGALLCLVFGGAARASFEPTDAAEGTIESTASSYMAGAAIAKEADGSFVVAWRTSSEVRARRFNASRVLLAPDFRVDTAASPINSLVPGVAIASDANGAFVVVWSVTGTSVLAGGSRGIMVAHNRVFMQRYGSDGVAIGGPTEVSQTLQAENYTSYRMAPTIAMTSDGAFVVAWKTINASFQAQIVVRQYASSGAPLGPEAVVTTLGNSNGSFPSVAMTSDGGFWVAWADFATTAQVRAQLHDSSGAKIGDSLRLDTTATVDHRTPPGIAIGSAGELLVAWRTTSSHAMLRRASAATDFQVDRSGSVESYYPVGLGADPDGRFIVAWSATPGGISQVKVRAFESDGVPIEDAGGETTDVTANTLVSSARGPVVGLGWSYDPVLVWTAYTDAYHVYMRGYESLLPSGPAKPTNVSATPLVGNTPAIAVSWSPGSSGATATSYYEVRVTRDGLAVPLLTTTVQVGTHSTAIDVGTDGTYRFQVAAVDAASAYSSFASSGDVIVDLLAPVTSLAFANFSHVDNGVTHIQAATVISLVASDNLTGVSETLYRIDGGAETPYDGPISLGLGAHTLAYWSVDAVDNVEAARSASIVVDPAPLAASFDVDGAEFSLGMSGLIALDSDLAQGAVAAWGTGSAVWRRLDLAGAFQGASQSASTSYSHDAAISQSGSWVGVYQTYVSNHVNAHTRAYDGLGAQLGCESKSPLWTAPSLDTSSADRFPAIDMAADGTYVAVSSSFGRLVLPDAPPCATTPTKQFDFFASGSGGIYFSTDVAVHPDGRFVVVWAANGGFEYGAEIFAQRFDASGTAVAPGFRVTDALTPGDALEPTVAIDLAGRFVVVWRQQTLNGFGNTDVRARRFAADGTPLGASSLVTDSGPLGYAEFNQDPRVATDVGGNLVVTWTRATDTQTDVWLRAYNANGAALGPGIQVNGTTAGNQGGAEIALSWEGNGLIAWNDGANVKARTWQFTYASAPGDPAAVSLAPAFSAAPTLTLTWSDSLLGTTPDHTLVEVHGPSGLVTSQAVPYGTTSVPLAGLIDGAYVAELTAVDELDNMSGTVTSNTAVVDTVPPALSIGLTAGVVSGDPVHISELARIVVTASDQGSGLATLTWTQVGYPAVPYTEPFLLAIGTWTIDFEAKDQAGNTSTQSITFVVHPVADPPEDLAFVPVATNADALTLAWWPPSQGELVVGYHVVVKDELGATLVDMLTAATEVLIEDLAGETTLTATVTSVDQYGFESLPATAEGFIDRTPPEVSIGLVPVGTPLDPEPTAVLNTTRITLTASDDRSGVSEIRYAVDQGPETIFSGHFRLPLGSHVVTFRAIDFAGNTSATGSWTFSVSEPEIEDRVCADEANEYMGSALAVDGPIALIGGNTKVWDFRWDGTTWSLAGTLSIPDKGPTYLAIGNNRGRFDLAGDAFVMSDPADQHCYWTGPGTFHCNLPDTTVPTGRERLIVYGRADATWSASATIFPDASATSALPRPVPSSIGGGGVIFDGTRIVAIAGGDARTGVLGAAFMFVQSNGTWVQEAAFQPPDLLDSSLSETLGAGFDGYGVALDGDWLYLTANNGETPGYLARTYFYEKEGSSWFLRTTIPDAAPLAAQGDTLVIGINVYQRAMGDVTTFTQVATLTNPLGAVGHDVQPVLEGDRILLGVPSAGAVISFERIEGVWTLGCVYRFSHDAASVGTQTAFAGDFALATVSTDDVDGVVNAGCAYVMIERPAFDFLCMNGGPAANAGGDLLVAADAACGADVTLDGRSSLDPDGDEMAFDWTLLSGPGLDAPTPIAGTGPKPTVRLGVGTWQIGLVVSDGQFAGPSDTITISVVDDDPPVLGGVPDDATETCDAVSQSAAVTADDNCGAALSFEQTRIDGEAGAYVLAGDYRLVRTWTATDLAGNTTSAAHEITVLGPPSVDVDDVEPPTAACVGGAIALDANGMATVDPASLDGGSTDACGIATLTASPPTLDCADLGSVDVTLTVADFDGNTDACLATVTVSEDAPPTAVCHDPAIVVVGSVPRQVVAADLDGGSFDACGPLVDRAATFPGLAAPPPTVTKLAPGIRPLMRNEWDQPDRWTRGYAIYQGAVYFAGQDAAHGGELFRYDGTSVALVADLKPGSDSSWPYELTVFDGKLYFTATGVDANGAAVGKELFAYDGTSVHLVGDFKPGSGGSYVWGLTVFDGALYLLLPDVDDLLHRWDGTTLTKVVSAGHPQGAMVVGILGVDSGKLYLNVRDWFDGLATWDGTNFVGLGYPGDDWVGSFDWPTFFQGKLYFASTETKGQELYRFDDPGFTRWDLFVGTSGSNPSYLTVFEDKLYFAAVTAQTGGVSVLQVWDGSSFTSPIGGYPAYLVPAGDVLYFRGNSPKGFELRRYDGATFEVIDVLAGPNSSFPDALFWTGTDLFFGAYDGSALSFYEVHQDPAEAVFDCSDAGTSLAARLTVTDDEGDSASCDTTVQIAAAGGALVCQDVTVGLDAATAPLMAADLDLNGGAIASCGGALSTSPTSVSCSDVGSTVPVTVAFSLGSPPPSCVANVTVVDAAPPVATCIPASDLLVVAYDAHFAWAHEGVVHVDQPIPAAVLDAGSSDNCGIDALAATRVDTGGAAVFSTADVGSDVALALAVDDGTSADECALSVSVLPLVDAGCVDGPIDLVLDAGGTPVVLTTADFDDGSSASIGDLLLSIDQATFGCADAGPNVVTLTARSDLYDLVADTCEVTVNVAGGASPDAVARDVTLDLDADGEAALTVAAADDGSTSGCGVGTMTVSPTLFTCAHVGVQSATLTVVDGQGQSDADDFEVLVRDVSPPDLVSQSVTRELDATGYVTVLAGDVLGGSSDNCDIATYALSQTQFGCADVGARPATGTVTDVNGNPTSEPVTVTIVDATIPLAKAKHVMVRLDGQGQGALTVAEVDDGSSDNCAIDALALDVAAFDCSDLGINPITLTARDPSHNEASATVTATVADAVPPAATCISPSDLLVVAYDAHFAWVYEGVVHVDEPIPAAVLDAGSSDNCGVESLAAKRADGGAAVFTTADVGADVALALEVDDGTSTSQCVVPVNVLPLVEADCVDGPITLVLDANGTPAELTIDDVDAGSSTSIGNLLLTIDQTTFGCADAGPNVVTLTARSDLYDFVQDTCEVTVDVVGSPSPEAIAQDVTLDLDAAGQATLTVAAVDAGSDPGCGTGTMTVAPTSFTCDDVGTQGATLTIVDSLLQSDSDDLDVLVRDVLPPDLVSQAVTRDLDATGHVTVLVADVLGASSDNCDLATYTLSQTQFGCADVGLQQETGTVTDVNGNSTSEPVTIEIVDATAPLARAKDVTVSLDDQGQGALTAAELDDGSSDNCGIDALAIDVAVFDCADLGANLVTLTARDPSHNEASATATATVVDDVPPTATCAPDRTMVTAPGTCQGSLSVAELTVGLAAVDNCTASTALLAGLTAVRSDGAPLAAPFSLGVTTIDYTLTDAAGNDTSCSQRVTVEDHEAPTVSLDDQVIAGCDGAATFAGPEASDNCPGVTVTTTPSLGAGLGTGSHTVTAVATDASGNSASDAALISVIEALRVVFTSPIADDNAPDDILTDADVINVVKAGSVVPHKVQLRGCSGLDVTEAVASSVTAWLIVVPSSTTSVPNAINAIASDYNGVGDEGGRMVRTGDHWHYNRDTDDLVPGVRYQSIVWVEWNMFPGLVAGIEDAALRAR